MAINLASRYTGRVNAPDSNYPRGSIKNKSPGVDDGTPLDAAWGNDLEGFLQSLLSAAGVTANNVVDRVGASQFYDALVQIINAMDRSNAPTTAYTRTLLDDANAAAARTTLGLGTAATRDVGAGNLQIPLNNNLGALSKAGAGAGLEIVSNALRIMSSYTPLGVSQTWQNVTDQRSYVTTYTNTTGRPIAVSVWTKNASQNGGIVATVSGQSVGYLYNDGGGTGAVNRGLFFIVPAGNTYQVTVTGPNPGGLDGWKELR